MRTLIIMMKRPHDIPHFALVSSCHRHSFISEAGMEEEGEILSRVQRELYMCIVKRESALFPPR